MKSAFGTLMRSTGVRHRAVVIRVFLSSRRLPSPKNSPCFSTVSRLSSLSDKISTFPELMKNMASPSSPGRYMQSSALWCWWPSLEKSCVKSDRDSPAASGLRLVASIISFWSFLDRAVPVTFDTTRPRSSPSMKPFDDASKTSNARFSRCVSDDPPSPSPVPSRLGPSMSAANIPVWIFVLRSLYIRSLASDPASADLDGVSPLTHGCCSAVIAVRRSFGSLAMSFLMKSLADGLRCEARPIGGEPRKLRILSCISSSDDVPSGSKGWTPTIMM